MNIIEQIAEVNRLIDRTKSARFNEQTKIIPAINLAIQKWFNDAAQEFQSDQCIRDYMSSLVVHRFPIIPVNTNQIIYPDDYVHEVAFAIVVDGNESSCRSATYNEINKLPWNSFTRVIGKSQLEQAYKIEANKIQYVTFSGTIFSTSYLSYIRNFKPVSKGTALIVAGPAVLIIGMTYYVNSGTVTHDSVSYTIGQTFIAVSTVLTGTGNVIIIQNCEIGVTEHEAICQYAAADLLKNIKDNTSAQANAEESGK